jgi:hypothetical protein
MLGLTRREALCYGAALTILVVAGVVAVDFIPDHVGTLCVMVRGDGTHELCPNRPPLVVDQRVPVRLIVLGSGIFISALLVGLGRREGLLRRPSQPNRAQ